MFRTSLLIAALALSAAVGVAHANDGAADGNVAETLRPAASASNSMAGDPGARIEVIAGSDRAVVVYSGSRNQNFAAPGRLVVTPTDGGSFVTSHDPA
jgi:hypothetical protein